MPVKHTGNSYNVLYTLYEHTELTEQLIGLSVSSEIAESTVLNTIRRIDATQSEIKIPTNLASNIYALFNYDIKTASWVKIPKFKAYVDKIVLDQKYSGLTVAFPFDAFRTSFYSNGVYDFEMYIARVDSKVYRNITLSASTMLQSPYVTLLFSFSPNGPWLPEISSSYLFSTFYMRVVVTNKNTLKTTQVIPSEIIALSCLVCE